MDTAERQLRAYVIVNTTFGVKNFVEGRIPSVDFILTDVGQTPVYKEGTVAALVLTQIEPTYQHFDSCDKIYDRPDVRIGYFGRSRQETMFLSGNAKLTSADMEHIKAGELRFILFARICYEDIYNKARWTDFCFRWEWQKEGFADSIACKEGNSADH